MKKIFLIISFLSLILSACTTGNTEIASGVWRGTLQTNGGELPFGLEIQGNADKKTYKVLVINGEEKLPMDTAFVKEDSLHIPMSIFDAELVGKISDKTLNGVWRKKRSNGTFIVANFKAEFDKKYRFFEQKNNVTSSLSGKYATTFVSADKKDTSVAVGLFNQNKNEVKGTFLTTTGDYRFLAGDVKNDSLYLSCFDGTHAFLFKAKFDSTKKTLEGQFWSNGTNLENWTAIHDEKVTLPDEKSLTFLKKGYSTIKFSFPNTENKVVSLSDEKFRNKVVIVQILGTWCPNCMDESKFLAAWYKKNKQRGIEIVGLSYEKYTDPAVALPKIKAMKQRFGMDYEVLFAGSNDKNKASESLPMLNKVMGFPTTIFIDRKGTVREIHTGFSGPGTGEYYDKFVSDFNRLIDKLAE